MLRRAAVGGSCCDRRVVEAEVEVEVVTGALVRGGRVLLVHRSPLKRAFPGVWDLPGGVVEPGESLVEALVRELREELDVRVDAGSCTPLAELSLSLRGDLLRMTAYRVGAWRGTPVNAAPDEHDDLAWFGLDDLPDLAHAPVRSALVEVLRG